MPITRLVCLDVGDPAGYQRYRDAMKPIFDRVGGRFLLDIQGGELLASPAPFVANRVFLIQFPDAGVAEAFFTDPDYQVIRAAHFETSVRQTFVDPLE